MSEENIVVQQELDKEFLKHLHEEKLKTQAERAKYIFSKIAFITGLFGLGSLEKIGFTAPGIFYLIPVVAIGYDLYINAADSSIKKMGAFLGKNPKAGSGESEQAWENDSGEYRDILAPLASFLFSVIVTISAWLYSCYESGMNVILSFLTPCGELLSIDGQKVWFIFWLVVIFFIHIGYFIYIKILDKKPLQGVVENEGPGDAFKRRRDLGPLRQVQKGL